MRSSELPRSTTGKLQRHELARLPLNDDHRVGNEMVQECRLTEIQ
jgi:acyl-coenzyme A synthetase/AMP-(fatty) acid ligase